MATPAFLQNSSIGSSLECMTPSRQFRSNLGYGSYTKISLSYPRLSLNLVLRNVRARPRGLAGKLLAGFFAIPSRRISILCDIMITKYVSSTQNDIDNRCSENDGLWRIGVSGPVSRTLSPLSLTTTRGKALSTCFLLLQRCPRIDPAQSCVAFERSPL